VINTHEREILEAVAGDREWPMWGAWVSECLSFLLEDGFITSETDCQITDKGRAALKPKER